MLTYVPFGYTSYAPGFNNSSKHMDWLGGIGLGMSAINGIWNAISGSNNNRRQIEFARESQDKQMAFQREMFNAENAYNTPAMQMRRLIDAGINPVSAWSNGMSANTGNGQTSGTFTPGSPQTSPVPSPFAGMIGTNPFGLLQAQLNAEKTKADIKKTGADTRNVDQMTENAKINQILLDYKRQREEAAAPYFGKEAYNDIMKKINENDVLVKTAANLLKQGDLIEAEKEAQKALKAWYDIQHDYKELQLPYAVSDILSEIAERKSSANKNNADANQTRELTPILKNLNKAEFNKKLREIRGVQIKNRSDAIDVLRKTLNVDENAVNNLVRRLDASVHKGLYNYTAEDLADFLDETYYDELKYDK